MGKKQRQAEAERLAAIPAEEGRVILATGKYIGEGFDDPRLDTLFLTLPVSWRGTIAQYVGRLHRLHDGKREVRVYDYADLNVPMLARMFDRRCRGYRRDRRKDQLLQESGYLVLRYLAEDLAKELDLELDGILRSLSSRRKPGPTAIPITVV